MDVLVEKLDAKLRASKEDSIGYLGLTNRSLNALRRSGIWTVGEVAHLIESGMIGNRRGLGRKCILEIEDRIAHVKIEEISELGTIKDTTIRIGQLKLSKRSFNALRNAGIQTVAEVTRFLESGEIRNIRGLGSKCILEIQDKLTKVEISESREVNVNPDANPMSMNLDAIPDRVIIWQLRLVAKQLSMELLHEHAKVADRRVKDWLGEIEKVESKKAYETLAIILSSSFNICEELEFLINLIASQHCMDHSVIKVWS